MGRKRALAGHLSERGVVSLLRAIHADQWSGALRLRSGQRIGALWLVRGQVVHAILLEDQQQYEGIPALENLVAWNEGTYFLEPGALPPARTIRLGMADILHALAEREEALGEEPGDQVGLPCTPADLSEVLDRLRQRVPGLESLSLARDGTLEITTARDEAEQTWLRTQLRTHLSTDQARPDKLFLQQGDHAILIVHNGSAAAVLSAGRSTAPEALFWAAEEAARQVHAEKQGEAPLKTR